METIKTLHIIRFCKVQHGRGRAATGLKPKIENLGLLQSKSRVSLSFKVFEVVFRIFEKLLSDML